MNDLVPVLDESRIHSLTQSFLSGKAATTLRGYRGDLNDFAAFTNHPSIEMSLIVLLSAGNGRANEIAHRYKAAMLEQQLSPATINRRLAALRSVVQLARTIGMISWSLDVPSVKSIAYRDTRGPGIDGVRSLLQDAAARDGAIIHCLFDLGLRREEVCRLDLEDYDAEQGTLAVLGKGHLEKQRLTVPEPTKIALNAWIAQRGPNPGPMFLNFDRAKKGTGRLTGRGLYSVIRKLGESKGLRTRPHGLRHTAITAVLDISDGDVRAAARFSRHRNLQTLCLYDDARTDDAGKLASQLAGSI